MSHSVSDKTRGLADLLVTDKAYAARYESLQQDVIGRKSQSLKSKYPGEFQSWKNRKRWCKAHSQPWDKRMESFPSFLLANGPIPHKAWTLDRIKSCGHYTLENLRWASKSTQSQNRSTARKFSVAGQDISLIEAASMLGKSVDAVRMSMNRRGAEHVASQLRLLMEAHKDNRSDPESLWVFPKLYRLELEEEYSIHGRKYPNKYRFFKAELQRYLKQHALNKTDGFRLYMENYKDWLARRAMRLARFSERQLKVIRHRAHVRDEAERMRRAHELGEMYEGYPEGYWFPAAGPWEISDEDLASITMPGSNLT